MRNELDYIVRKPNDLYRGKGYSDWIEDWYNWFLSADADKHTHGPVVFLRSLGLPNRTTGAFIPDVPAQVSSSSVVSDQVSGELSYSKAYVNDPNIRIGSDRLQIYEDQAVLIPVIVAYELANAPYKDWGSLQEFTGFTIDYGDNPPDESQLKIDEQNIKFPENLHMKDFRFVTRIFTAIIPDTEYGRSVKDFLEIKVSPGIYPAMVEGYFVLLNLSARDETYLIRSYASGPRELTGIYFSDLYYEIEVNSRPEPGKPSIRTPPRNELIRNLALSRMMQLGMATKKQEVFLKTGKDSIKGIEPVEGSSHTEGSKQVKRTR
jgi:hypothetical protein